MLCASTTTTTTRRSVLMVRALSSSSPLSQAAAAEQDNVSTQSPLPLILASPLHSRLRNPSLLSPETCGTAFSSDSRFYEVRDPAHPETILAHVPIQTASDVRSCIERSAEALEGWRDGTTGVQRSQLLQHWSQRIQDNGDDLATIMTLESGKPLAESRAEIAFGRSFLDYFAAEAVRPNSAGGGFLVPTPFTTPNGTAPRGQALAVHQAVGVTALITPWNFPLAMMARKVGPALAAGCTAIVKPSEHTPLTALALQHLAADAGIPDAVLQIVTPDRDATPDVGRELCTHPAVRKLSFTGSTAVGQQLMRWSSTTVQRLSLELGGNAPFVVFDDCNIDQAVRAAAASKFRNAGQTCVCADRFLVQAGVHDAFCERFAAHVRDSLTVGPGMDEANNLGPLITEHAVEAVHAKVRAAVEEDGATCVLGGAPLSELGPQFYAPTVMTHVSEESDIWKTETFGPVAAIRSFETEEEALRLANDCRSGLAAYFCTQDLSRAFRFAQK